MQWQMLQIKHFTALQKMPHFQDLQTGHGGTKYSVLPCLLYTSDAADE